MRIANGVMFFVMLVFVAVQYNDPDYYFWMPIYAVPAVWAAIATIRPALLASSGLAWLLWTSLFAAVAAAWWFWPTEPAFWRKDVWWESEAAREGMGMMVVVVALVLSAAVAARTRTPSVR